MKEVNLIAKLADLQEVDYHNTLVLHAVIELLVAKGFFTREELSDKMTALDTELTFHIDTYAKLTETAGNPPLQIRPIL
ncbi:hypothetical protein ACFSO0_02635 [Brevibacillus sp. GCM10020057]|uniref:hypothetical protein n=1 Tax=Brevibacillus sp. GCM10020057 TaxID=3317327 RepID=UPI003639F9D7